MFGALVALAVAVYQRAADASLVAPALLSETGLTGPGVRTFSPQYPLWSDGATKRRWVHLPEGTTIDVSNPEIWVFPDGTRFWKEFSIGGRKVETRMLWKRGEEWVFASYLWNDSQTDATLVPEAGVTTTAEVAPGRRHRIPGGAECRACHDSSRTEILGFGALQLSDDRDPNALHADAITADSVTLRTLVKEGLTTPRRPEWVTSPPRIEADTPETRAVLGYLSTNCGSCHNPESSIANVGLNLKASIGPASTPCPVAIAATVNVAGLWAPAHATPGTTHRITPGQPDLSTLLLRMRSRRPSTQMPPLGTEVADEEAVARVTKWIASGAIGGCQTQ
jgi:hypothetical protein